MSGIGIIDIDALEYSVVLEAAVQNKLRGYGFRTNRGARLLVQALVENREVADVLAKALGMPLSLELVDNAVFPEFSAFQEIEIAESPPTAWGHIEGVDANGKIHGWSSPSEDRCVSLRFLIDGIPAGETIANIFRIDLLKARVGLGAHAFKFRPPDRFLDGEAHKIEVEVVETGRRFERFLRLPFHFNCPRPWFGIEQTPGWSPEDERELQQAKQRAMQGESLDSACVLVERKPMAIWRDLGLFERHARRGARMPTFRRNLNRRWVLFYGSTPCRASKCCKGKPFGHDTSLIWDCPLLMRHFASKPFVKEYGAWMGVSTPQTLELIASVEDFDRFDLPDRYVLKPESDSGRGIFLMHHGLNLFDGLRYSREDLRGRVLDYLAKRKGARFIIEEFLTQEGLDPSQPTIPLDYKMHAFGGKVRITHVDDRNAVSRDPLHRDQSWLSRDWVVAPYRMRVAEQESFPIRSPSCFPQMLEIADRLATDLKDYVRIDMYASDRGPVLGELTTYSHAGVGFTDYGNLILSQAWELFPDLAQARL